MTRPCGYARLVTTPLAPARRTLHRPSWIFFALLGVFVALCAGAATMPLTRDMISNVPIAIRAISLGIVIVGTLVIVSLHEWAHARVAYAGGDVSVRDKGYLTLDFRRYSDPLLSIGFPLLFLLLGGLPLPGGAVWITTSLLRSRWWATAVSLAGSCMNLIAGLGLAGLVASGALDQLPVLAASLAWLGYIHVGVALLNLLPFPGLDGFGALEPHLSDGARRALAPIRSYGLLILIALMMLGLLNFLWGWADVLVSLTGIDTSWIALGSVLASTRV